jgi:cytochrome c oxidase cbb3-type subunit 3
MKRPASAIGLAIAAAWTTVFVIAQGTAPAPQGNGQAPPQTGTAQTPPARGQGGRGGAGDPNGRGRFTQFARPQASQEAILRGKALYDSHCASCHAPDLRGTADGKYPSLRRSGVALRDANGELIGAKVAQHTPKINLVQEDAVAIADYIHSALADESWRALPASSLNVLVGDAEAGKTLFASACGSCHSATGDLKGIASKFEDARALQNGWVSGSRATFAGGGGGGRGGGAGVGNPATVTLADGTKLNGTLVREDPFLVVITLPDGTRKSFARTNDVPKVEVKDPAAAHKAMLLELAFADADNAKMHNLTAYLWTLK